MRPIYRDGFAALLTRNVVMLFELEMIVLSLAELFKNVKGILYADHNYIS